MTPSRPSRQTCSNKAVPWPITPSEKTKRGSSARQHLLQLAAALGEGFPHHRAVVDVEEIEEDVGDGMRLSEATNLQGIGGELAAASRESGGQIRRPRGELAASWRTAGGRIRLRSKI